MIITCPECSTHYTVDAKTLGQSGREVRCASCGHKWFATPQDEQPAPAPEEPDEPVGDDPGDEEKTPTVDEAPEPVEELAPEAPQEASKPAPAHRKFREKLEAKAKRKRVFIAIGAWSGVAASLMLVFVLAIMNRTAIVKTFPKTAGTFAAIGLPVSIWGVDLKDTKSERVWIKGEDVLRISGELYNPGDTSRTAPFVRISMLDETNAEIHAWTVAVDQVELPAHSGAHFVTTVKNPPPQAVGLDFALTDVPLGDEMASQKGTHAQKSDH